MNLVKILSLIIPELKFSEWSRIISRLECGLGVLLKNVLYLSCPSIDGGFQNVSLIFIGLDCVSSDVLRREWEVSPTLDLTICDLYLCEEDIEFIHKIL